MNGGSVTLKGQVTIPRRVREILHIKAGDKVDWVTDGERAFLLPLKGADVLSLKGALKGLGKGSWPRNSREIHAVARAQALKRWAKVGRRAAA